MSSAAQIAANRLNAQQSTGPRTVEGKDASRRNSFKHGLTSCKVFPAERQEEYQQLAARYCDELQPDGVEEEQKIETMVHARWNARCFEELHNQVWETLLRGDENRSRTQADLLIADFLGPKVLDRMQRYLRNLQRTYNKAAEELEKSRRVRQMRQEALRPLTREQKEQMIVDLWNAGYFADRSAEAATPAPAPASTPIPGIGFVSSPADRNFNPALKNPKKTDTGWDNPALRL